MMILDLGVQEHSFRQLDFLGAYQITVIEQSLIATGIFLPLAVPALKMGKLDVQDRRLQAVQTEIAADDRVIIFWLASMHS